ncbi:hypothetical protein V3G39_01395 [Dermatophilaceae bacterium Sec6.4]|nr:hypothetical protein [Actinomycetota bacterium]
MIRRVAAAAALPMIAGLGIALAAPAHAITDHTTSGSTTPGHSAQRQAMQHQSLQRAAAKIKANKTSADSPLDGPFYGSCRLIVPTTARVVQDTFEVPVRVTGGCALHPGPLAIWYTGPSFEDATDGIIFANEKSSTWDLYRETQLGTRTWKAYGAIDEAGNSYSQDTPKTTVKVGSWSGLQTSRSGNKVTLASRTVRYATSLDRNIAWADESGTIQYRANSGSAWTNLKTFKTNSAGATSYSYNTSQTRDYRVVYNENPYIWGSTSPTSRR